MKRIRISVGLLLLALTACGPTQTQPGTVTYDPNAKAARSAPEALFSSLEIIPLTAPEEVVIDTESDVLRDDSCFYVIDALHRKRIDIFDRRGRHIGAINASGRSGSEYLDINRVQLVDSLVAVYSYHNRALYYYDRSGAFVGKDTLQYAPIDLLKLRDGYWGYAGNSGEIPSRVVRMDAGGRIVGELLPAAKVIPMQEKSSVFIPCGTDLILRENLRRDILRIDSAGTVHPFLTLDFGRYNVPDAYFESEDPMAAATGLMQSDFASLDRLFLNGAFTVLTVDFQTNGSGGEPFGSLGVCHGERWRWLRAGNREPQALFFTAARALTPDSELLLITDTERLAALKRVCPELVPDLETDTDNTCIVLCHLKD